MLTLWELIKSNWKCSFLKALPRQEVVRQEPSEESSLSVGLLDLATAPATDPEEEMLAKQYVKKKKKPQRKRGFRL